MPATEIISHPLCPFQHRLRLIEHARASDSARQVRFVEIPYFEFPKRIRDYSPSGDSPVLMIDGKARSTSTEHIAEYLDGLHGLGVLPGDPAARLEVRLREQRAGAVLHLLRGVFTARDRSAFDTALAAFFDRLRADEADGIFAALDPDGHTIDVAAWAGAFTLIWGFAPFVSRPEWDSVPQARALGQLLVARDDVRATATPHQGDEFVAFFAMTGSAFPELVLPQ